MFHSARITLTAWYVLIVMIISLLFSAAIYDLVQFELVRDFHHLQERYNAMQILPQTQPLLEQGYLEAAERRVLLNLLYLNLIILGVSSASGYFLAGRTLKPIQKIVDQQNQFISDASHELRTPITAAKTSIEVGLRDKSLNLPQAKELLNGTLDDINTMQRLADNLLTLAQTENGKSQQLFSKIDVNSVLTKAKENVQPLAKKKNMSIAIKKSALEVLGNFDSLVELFVILFDNAIKYGNKKTDVTVSTKKTDGFAVITVIDQGIGIAEKDLPHIFDRFYRAETSRSKENAAGYGLGLAIAKQIVDEHSGTIGVKSKVDKGTTFIIRLPANNS